VSGGSPLYVLVDCGSTTTKALLVGRRDGRFCALARTEAFTTVEAPQEDVMVGLETALRALEAESGEVLLQPDPTVSAAAASGPPVDPEPVPETNGASRVGRPWSLAKVAGVLATSSAGGGLQMAVVGLVREMTVASGERAALGAGALVSEVIAFNDAEAPVRQIERLRRCQPDAVLLCGGTDGGATQQVVALAEMVAAAELHSRHATDVAVPVIYAGNRSARKAVGAALAAHGPLRAVANLRPSLATERLQPARARIHNVFLQHVMSRAPGFAGLRELCTAPVAPTPAAFASALELLSDADTGGALAVDVGGATTDVYSTMPPANDRETGDVHRTVSANLGLSFSIGNVCRSAGWDRIARWLAVSIAEEDLRNGVRNKMIRPTTVPQTRTDLQVEQAVTREALRLALAQHGASRRSLRGVRPDGPAALRLGQDPRPEDFDWRRIGLVIGSGGPLSHAPQRAQAAAMLVDGLRPGGITSLAVDAAFLLPHIGILARHDAEAARQVLYADCLVALGVVIAPLAEIRARPGEVLLEYDMVARGTGRVAERGQLAAGEFLRLKLDLGKSGTIALRPAAEVDLGAGKGTPIQAIVAGGAAGVLLDGRGSDLGWPQSELLWRRRVEAWRAALGIGQEVEA